MRVPAQILPVLLVMFSLSMVFTNCQQPVDFKTSEGSSKLGLPPTTVEEVEKSCSNTTPTSMVAKAVFPKPNATCAWGVDGNLSPLNQYFRGRIEQTAQLELPAGATVCNMVFSFNKQQFLYDDHFLLAFDDSLLASSYDFSEALERKNGLLTYDWSKIAGQYWDSNPANKKEGVFCASVKDKNDMDVAGTCSWPQTEVAGNIEISLPKEVFYSVMAHNSARTEHEFKFVSIGDNDSLDCEHSHVEFQVLVEYIITH